MSHRVRGWLAAIGAGTTIAAIAVGSVLLGGTEGSDDASRSPMPAVAPTADSVAEVFDAVGVTVKEPPSDTKPAVTGAEAIAAVAADGLRPDIQESAAPVARLVTYRKHLGDTKLDVDVLVWDVVFADAPQADHGGPAGIERDETPLPCDLHVIVDATTGQVIEGFQTGCTVTPHG